MICQTCNSDCHAQYFNRTTKKAECENCTPYLNEDIASNRPRKAKNSSKWPRKATKTL